MSGPSSSGLVASCDICGPLRRKSPYTQPVTAKAALPAFGERARRGCRVCAIICNAAVTRCDAWSSVAPAKLLICASVSQNRNESSKELNIMGYELLRPCPLEQAEWLLNSRYLFTTKLRPPLKSPSHIKRIPTLPIIPQDRLSDLTREMLRGWLEACDGHPDCRSTGSKMLPKRLVDVGDGDDATIKIVSATEGHRYLAFSHCWGSGRKPLSTTKANEALMQLAISWESLPQSFQDAIRVTKWLNARYIWIDSLCIVQDDEQDWEEESAKMAGIFSGCDLAIAASRASSCEEGFLQAPVISGTQPSWRDRYTHKIYSGAVPQPFDKLPLFNRGWCFQERLLAPRTLHFARDELFFQCRTEDRCECRGRGAWQLSKSYCYAYYTATISQKSRFIRAFEKQEQEHLDTGSNSNDEAGSSLAGGFNTTESFLKSNETALIRRLYANITEDRGIPINFGQMWGRIVSDYASLDLTFQRDVLPALSGIANLMLAYCPGRYFAGLWELDIHYLLGWSSVLADGRCYRPQEATAPSFSWASRFGPVSFPFECHITRVCTVLDIRCEAKGADPYGQVLRGGYIVLQGQLISGTVNIYPEHRGWDCSVDVFDVRGEKYSGCLDFDTEEDEKSLGQGTNSGVYCFNLFCQTELEDETDEEVYTHAIVLIEDDEPGTFKRVGTAFYMSALAYNDIPDVTVKIK